MMKVQPFSARSKNAGDAAIDGLFAGLIAGVAMMLILILAGLLIGETPAGMLERFSTGQSATPAAGGLIHLAVSGIYGVFFSLLVQVVFARPLRRIPGWPLGLAYGLLLLGLAVAVLLPGLRSPLQELPLGILAGGHMAYGLILGWRVTHLNHPV